VKEIFMVIVKMTMKRMINLTGLKDVLKMREERRLKTV
jgi:hypothetical protein